jgi:hypothetical protein
LSTFSFSSNPFANVLVAVCVLEHADAASEAIDPRTLRATKHDKKSLF